MIVWLRVEVRVHELFWLLDGETAGGSCVKETLRRKTAAKLLKRLQT